MAAIKRRLDQLVVEQHPQITRAQAQSFIMQGYVTVNGEKVVKSGIMTPVSATIVLSVDKPKYVSRAGWKLEAAVTAFHIPLLGTIALDAGLSTGGFTDCLLQYGAQKVYGVDVGYGLVHESLRNDPRVVVRERTNLRYLDPLSIPEKVDIVTLDLAFISVLKVMHVVRNVLKNHGHLVVLIKPQFEARREQVGRGGIITDPAVHREVIEHICTNIVTEGFELQGVIDSPILGGSGNKEFLGYFKFCPDRKQ